MYLASHMHVLLWCMYSNQDQSWMNPYETPKESNTFPVSHCVCVSMWKYDTLMWSLMCINKSGHILLYQLGSEAFFFFLLLMCLWTKRLELEPEELQETWRGCWDNCRINFSLLSLICLPRWKHVSCQVVQWSALMMVVVVVVGGGHQQPPTNILQFPRSTWSKVNFSKHKPSSVYTPISRHVGSLWPGG